VTVTEAGARPRSVSVALVLLGVGIVLSLVGSALLMVSLFRGPPPEFAGEFGNPVLRVWLGVFAVLLVALSALPVVLLVAIARRKQWAVWVYLALIALGFLAQLSDPGQLADGGLPEIAVSVLMWGLQATAFVLLFSRPSRAWFDSGNSGAGAGPGEWRADPSGRHQHRYWDGSAWTAHVADEGQVNDDPFDQSEQACP